MKSPLLNERWEEQERRDAELKAQRYTGVEYDRVTNDYAGWLNGHVVTWARSYTECESRLGVQISGPSWAHGVDDGAGEGAR